MKKLFLINSKGKWTNTVPAFLITFLLISPHSHAIDGAIKLQGGSGISTTTSGTTYGGEIDTGGASQNQIPVTGMSNSTSVVGAQKQDAAGAPSEDITSSIDTAINNAVQGFVQPDPTQILGPRVRIGKVIPGPNGTSVGVITYDQNDIVQIAYDDQSLELYTQDTPLNRLMTYLGYGVNGQRSAPLTISDAGTGITSYNSQNPILQIPLTWVPVEGIADSIDYARAFLNGQLVTDYTGSAIFHDYMGVHGYQIATFPETLQSYVQKPLQFLVDAYDNPVIMADPQISNFVLNSLDNFSHALDTATGVPLAMGAEPGSFIAPDGENFFISDGVSRYARIVPSLEGLEDIVASSPEAAAALQKLVDANGGVSELQSYAQDPALQADLQAHFETLSHVLDIISEGGTPFTPLLTEDEIAQGVQASLDAGIVPDTVDSPGTVAKAFLSDTLSIFSDNVSSVVDGLSSPSGIAGTALLGAAAVSIANDLVQGNYGNAGYTAANVGVSIGAGAIATALGLTEGGVFAAGSIPGMLLAPNSTASNDTVFATVPNDPASIAAANANFNSGVQTTTQVLNSHVPLSTAAAAMSVEGTGDTPALTSYLTPQFAQSYAAPTVDDAAAGVTTAATAPAQSAQLAPIVVTAASIAPGSAQAQQAAVDAVAAQAASTIAAGVVATDAATATFAATNPVANPDGLSLGQNAVANSQAATDAAIASVNLQVGNPTVTPASDSDAAVAGYSGDNVANSGSFVDVGSDVETSGTHSRDTGRSTMADWAATAALENKSGVYQAGMQAAGAENLLGLNPTEQLALNAAEAAIANVPESDSQLDAIALAAAQAALTNAANSASTPSGH